MNLYSRAFARLAPVLATGAVAASSFAVVATTSSTTLQDPDGTFNFVGKMGAASAVAVGYHAVLTARHVAVNDFVLNVSGVSTTYHVDPLRPAVNAPNNWDLKVVYVTEALPGFYEVASSVSVADTVTMVGYGASGIVSGTTTGYFVQSGTEGTRRAGNGRLDLKQDVPGIGPTIQSYLRAKGDAVLAGGDSGGGWFAGGKLVGISSFFFNDTDPVEDDADPAKYSNFGFASRNTGGFNSVVDAPHYTGPAYTIAPGEAYFGSGAVDLTDSRVQGFLGQAVPEPTSMAALALGAAAILRRRRRS